MKETSRDWRWHFVLLGLVMLLLAGCASPPSSSATRSQQAGTSSNRYALLFDLMGDEKDVSKLLIIKRERPELRQLIKQIAERCGRAYKDLESMGKADRGLELKETGLPEAELKTRKSISKARAKELLTDGGKDFELHLLLTQNEALTYGTHLARTAAESEPDQARKTFFRSLATDLDHLREQVGTMLLSNYSLPASK